MLLQGSSSIADRSCSIAGCPAERAAVLLPAALVCCTCLQESAVLLQHDCSLKSACRHQGPRSGLHQPGIMSVHQLSEATGASRYQQYSAAEPALFTQNAQVVTSRAVIPANQVVTAAMEFMHLKMLTPTQPNYPSHPTRACRFSPAKGLPPACCRGRPSS